MRTAHYQKYNPISSENLPLQMELYERDHLEHFYNATNQLSCWGPESSYLDSEFSYVFENRNRENQIQDNEGIFF